VRVGVCTGGGDCPGLNAAIRAIVKYASTRHTIIGIHDSFNGLISHPLRYTELSLKSVVDILCRGGTILGTYNHNYNKLNKRPDDNNLDNICAGFKNLSLEALIVIGGEGTHSVAQKLIKKGLPIIGLPKTIDNDLPETDQTIGFSTCVDLVAESVIRLQSTAESHDRVMILEVMGRDSGYISLHGGLAGGANIILIPEIPFDYNVINKKIKDRQKLGRNFSVIVVAEGAKNKIKQDKQIGNIGQIIANKISQISNVETRVTVLGHLQRGGQPNASDRNLATTLAIHAVDLIDQKKFSRIVISKNADIIDIPYNNIKKWERKKISTRDKYLIAAESIGVCLGR
jgi:ATP-dependent phosphofructokinase / diphosphate-dependent phosphofructokinase